MEKKTRIVKALVFEYSKGFSVSGKSKGKSLGQHSKCRELKLWDKIKVFINKCDVNFVKN